MPEVVFIISRDRADRISRVIPYWETQDVRLIVKTEPGQVDEYRAALEDRAEVLGHDKPDMGVPYARQSVQVTAQEMGVDAYVIADDDTVIEKGDARTLTDFVRSGVAMCVGGWRGVHGSWFPEVKNETRYVVPHYSDAAYAVNTRLLEQAGGYDTDKRISGADTQELYRIGIAVGYLWWVHTGVRIKVLGTKAEPGGIASTPMETTCPTCGGATFRTMGRNEIHKISHSYAYEKWGSYYVSHPSKKYSTRAQDFIRDHMGPEAAEIARTKRAFLDDDPAIPHGRVDPPDRPRFEQGSLLVPSVVPKTCTCN